MSHTRAPSDADRLMMSLGWSSRIFTAEKEDAKFGPTKAPEAGPGEQGHRQ